MGMPKGQNCKAAWCLGSKERRKCVSRGSTEGLNEGLWGQEKRRS